MNMVDMELNDTETRRRIVQSGGNCCRNDAEGQDTDTGNPGRLSSLDNIEQR